MLTVVVINPETIGAYSEYSEDWLKLLEKLGYSTENPPFSIAVIPIQTSQ